MIRRFCTVCGRRRDVINGGSLPAVPAERSTDRPRIRESLRKQGDRERRRMARVFVHEEASERASEPLFVNHRRKTLHFFYLLTNTEIRLSFL